MTKQEFAVFAAAIRTYYPREQILPNEQAMALWYRELKDIPANVAEAALRKWVSTNKWSPSIAEIRELASGICNEETPDWGEAWESVLKAIRRYGSYNPEMAMASLDPLTREAVRRLGYIELCLSENITADRANFRMVYETLEKRRKANSAISVALKQAIQRIRLDGTANMMIEDGKEK